MNQRKSLKELKMKCEEVPELKLDDGATRIFLNTRGKHPELVSPEQIELLKYMEHSTDEVSEACESKRIQEMHRRVCQIRASEKTEVKYMQSWEERIMIKQEGIAEGRIEGEKALLKNLIEKKMAKKIFCRANFGNVRGRCFRSREYYERDTERKVSVRIVSGRFFV